MKNPGSSLVTLPGLGFLLVLFLLAAFFGIRAMETLLAVLFLLCAAAYFWARLALSRIELEVFGEDICAFPGGEISFSARVKNAKMLPLMWLRVQLPEMGDSSAAPLSAEEGEIFSDFSWLMPHQSLTFSQRVVAARRGVLACESFVLFSGDGFGLSEKTRNAPLKRDFRFVVYPEVFPVDASAVLRNMTELERCKGGLYTDKTLIKSVRDYHEGDSLKDINWRLLARGGAVQVNVREQISPRRVCFVPDFEDFSYVTRTTEGKEDRVLDRAGFERMLSVMASLILRLSELGVFCSLALPQDGAAAPRTIVPEALEGQEVQLLTAIAEIKYSGARADFPIEEIIDRGHLLGQLFLFSKAPGGQSGEEFVRRLQDFLVLRLVQRAPGEEHYNDKTIITEAELVAV